MQCIAQIPSSGPRYTLPQFLSIACLQLTAELLTRPCHGQRQQLHLRVMPPCCQQLASNNCAPCGGTKPQPSYLNSEHLGRASQYQELPVSLTEAFVAAAPQFSFSLCLILLLSHCYRYCSQNMLLLLLPLQSPANFCLRILRYPTTADAIESGPRSKL